MAALRFLLLSAVVVLLSAVTFTEGMRYSSGPKACCFEFTSTPVKLNMVKSFSFTSQQCSKEAILFVMKRGRQVCAKPSDPWVQKHIQLLQNKMSGSQQPL
ncbi:C-C motif chemokine 3-like 1 [Astyanax mexicanus]|uniref:C-C motif chemokine 3-like 1 n=2 Tax=Astyanax mexicanus TaxID=7994 RepID=A0A8B9H1A3_ASTMX|nr:C-C motif chemokine 3-like 1 [Astyanax mexicanus]KAG9272026.1 C-C motif chemokine 3-like 1 [Astyanax mexicanus]